MSSSRKSIHQVCKWKIFTILQPANLSRVITKNKQPDLTQNHTPTDQRKRNTSSTSKLTYRYTCTPDHILQPKNNNFYIIHPHQKMWKKRSIEFISPKTQKKMQKLTKTLQEDAVLSLPYCELDPEPLTELSTLALVDKQLPKNLNLYQQPGVSASSSSSLRVFLLTLDLDFPTSIATLFMAARPSPIFLQTLELIAKNCWMSTPTTKIPLFSLCPHPKDSFLEILHLFLWAENRGAP